MSTERPASHSQVALPADAPLREPTTSSASPPSPPATAAPAQPGVSRTSRSFSVPQALTTWVPFVTSLISFAIALYTFIITTQQPEIQIILPEQVRIAQGADYGFAYLYLQPTFVHTGASQRVEVIRNLRVEVRQASADDPTTFVWAEQGKLVYDQSVARALSYEYVADASPLLIGPNSAQSPFATFNGPSEWYFTPGSYQITLVAERAVADEDLTQTFRVTFTQENVDFLNENKGHAFLTFPLQ